MSFLSYGILRSKAKDLANREVAAKMEDQKMSQTPNGRSGSEWMKR